MRCPVDGTDLLMTERQGIEIDYCPKCRGVWLDRGELDKIVERSAGGAPPPRSRHDDASPAPRDHGDRQPHHRKRKSWLDDIFDF